MGVDRYSDSVSSRCAAVRVANVSWDVIYFYHTYLNAIYLLNVYPQHLLYHYATPIP